MNKYDKYNEASFIHSLKKYFNIIQHPFFIRLKNPKSEKKLQNGFG